MGKYKSFILLGAAVIIALITSVLIYTTLQKKSQKAVSPLPTQPVAVAVTDLAWGTALTKEMIKTVPYLKENLPEGCSSDPASTRGPGSGFPRQGQRTDIRVEVGAHKY